MRAATLLGACLLAPALALACSAKPALAPVPAAEAQPKPHPAPSAASPSPTTSAPAEPRGAPRQLSAALDPSQFLAAVDVTTSDTLAPDEIELVAPRFTGSNLGELSARHLLLGRREGGRLRIKSSPGYPAPTGAVQSRERRCSFVIDCDELSVRGLVAELRGAHSSIEATDVISYVYRFIEHKHMARGFDIASVVAEKREGDCTEHAVLSAALLRATGFPTHVVTGLALLRAGGNWAGFGHAWTEYHDGSGWQLADATGIGDAVEAIIYLPLRVMRDEGPGYSRGSFDAFDIVDVQSVSVSARLER